MADKGRSEPNLFGGYTHYDEKGNKIGTSEPDLHKERDADLIAMLDLSKPLATQIKEIMRNAK